MQRTSRLGLAGFGWLRLGWLGLGLAGFRIWLDFGLISDGFRFDFGWIWVDLGLISVGFRLDLGWIFTFACFY